MPQVLGSSSGRIRTPRPGARTALGACLLALGAVLAAPASAAEPLVSFQDGIGEQPFRANGQPNLVNGVSPGGFPWVISRLSADVSTDGRISADGRGLLLAGGNGIGTNGKQQVRARLFCDGVGAGDSDLVPLDERGDFRIQGALTQTPPSPCNTPVLLIVNANGAWFAAGIPKH